MSEQQASGQAFPTMERGGGGLDLADPGMTLRDYFAAKAFAAVLSTTCPWGELGFTPVNGKSLMENSALCAYEMADAMLRARALPQGSPDA